MERNLITERLVEEIERLKKMPVRNASMLVRNNYEMIDNFISVCRENNEPAYQKLCVFLKENNIGDVKPDTLRKAVANYKKKLGV